MPPTPSETDDELRHHDNAIVEIYAKLDRIEHRAGDFRLQVAHCVDRIETRLQVVDLALADRLDKLSGQLDQQLIGIITHLAGIGDHLNGLDATLIEMMNLPEPA